MNISPVLVQWTYHGTDETGFLLERSINSGSDGWPLRWGFDKNTLQYIDSAVGLYGTYWYRVAAANPKGTGSFSNLATVFIGPPAFDIAQLTASQVDKELENLLSWHYTGSSAGGADYYLIEKSFDRGLTWPVSWSVDPSASIWTEVSASATSASYYDVAYSPTLNRFMAVGEGSVIALSSDGVTWTDYSYPTITGGDWLAAVAWNPTDSKFEVASIGGYVYETPDGIVWGLHKLTPAFNYHGNNYQYVKRMIYDAAVNRTLIFGQGPPT